MYASSAGEQMQDDRQFAAYQAPVLILMLALCGVTILSLARPQVLFQAHSVTLQTAITTAWVVVGLGATYFALGEFLLYGRASSLCVGIAFLIFALADIG